MLIDYYEGAINCKTNSDRLSTSARIILNDSTRTDSFGFFLYHIAYKEMSKAIFCLFVDRGWVGPDFIKVVFAEHNAKIFLFDEIFRSFEMKDNRAYLGGEMLGQRPLSEFMKENKSLNRQHRKITNDFLYVNKGDMWSVPLVSVPNRYNDEEKIKEKILSLETVFYMIEEKLDGYYSHIKNFKIIESNDGFSIRYTTP